MRLFIVSNRLPVKVTDKNGVRTFTRSEGGVATGLNSLQIDCERHWIGWPGICTEVEEERREIHSKLKDMNFHPVFLSHAHIENYYEGYSNSTIWPLCHYFFAYTLYKDCFWQSYQEVNRIFTEEVCRLVRPDDLVWIQDYQLMLLPGMIRKRVPELGIGYFHHIPFPSYELFRILPERAEILKGLLGADFIGFHTHDYMRHFISAAERVLHVNFKLNETQVDSRVVRVDALPMGINYNLYHQAYDQTGTRLAIERMREQFGRHKLILSVDRLDYSKGILHRLKGFSGFLERHPEYHGLVTLAMVIVPSRDQVDSYAELKVRIDEEIGSINGRYSTMSWTPVCYFYHGFSFEELAALYYVSDIALVTPLRDGMNLVAKEYIATKRDNTGVLILSEMAGAAVEMRDALLINPNDTGQIERAILAALEMPEEEQRRRIGRMQEVISTATVDRWAADFIGGLTDTIRKNEELRKKKLSAPVMASIREAYGKARKRLILLDYDGTLAAIQPKPEDAVPTSALLDCLHDLATDPANHVVVNSGRDHFTLEAWLGSLPISMAAEHGAFYKEHGIWHKNARQPDWGAGILSILQMFVNKTPSSRLEVKETALAWHYRESDAWLGEMRAQQLANTLAPMCARQKLQIIQGDKVLEIKSPEHTKGSEVDRLMAAARYDFVLAMGDDTTDDDMFRALPEDALAIKVGNVSEEARFNLARQSDVLPFLKSLAEQDTTHGTSVNKQGSTFRLFGFLRELLKNEIR